MGQIKQLQEHGKLIIFVDGRNTKDTEMAILLNEERERMLKAQTEFRLIVDVTGSYTTKVYMDAARRISEDTKHLIIKGAIIGITGAKRVILRGYNLMMGDKSLRPVSSMEEAIKHVTNN